MHAYSENSESPVVIKIDKRIHVNLSGNIVIVANQEFFKSEKLWFLFLFLLVLGTVAWLFSGPRTAS